ncbi:MAG: hypothetical protein KBD46_02805 [Candidatus Levybacteria bacterium]|nr:hypothetical protein [Candidatus Levybacteria bacterium]
MIWRLNKNQKNTLSDFLKDIALAFFIGLFVVPKLSSDFDTLTTIKYLVNIGMYLTAALLLRKE